MTNRWLAGENPHDGSRHRKDRWLTPSSLTDPLGHFDLDPAGAPGHTIADRTYLIDQGEDGLVLPWNNRVWLNPPYGKLLSPFMARMAEHNHGTALIFARTETAMFHAYVWPLASAALFLRGRATFLDADGKRASANAGAPSVLLAYGDEDAHILRASGIDGAFLRLH